jgi:hypothetical protein
VRLGENLIDTLPVFPFIPPPPLHRCPSARGPRQPPSVGPYRLIYAPLWAKPASIAGPVSFKEIGPLLLVFQFLLFFYFLSLQFKFEFEFSFNSCKPL